MSDKQLIIDSIAEFGSGISGRMFGVNLGQAAEALIKMGVKNFLSKNPYKTMMDFLFDENDNLLTTDEFWETLKDILNQKPVTLMNVRFSGDDIDEIKEIFNKKK